MSCLFCKIVEGEIPSSPVFLDEDCYAFTDIHPQAPTHIVLIPRKHIASLAETDNEDAVLLGKLLAAAARIGRKLNLAKGYRVVLNNGPDGGQTVGHLHLHILGGRPLAWPPG